jgi:hypothetical protein
MDFQNDPSQEEPFFDNRDNQPERAPGESAGHQSSLMAEPAAIRPVQSKFPLKQGVCLCMAGKALARLDTPVDCRDAFVAQRWVAVPRSVYGTNDRLSPWTPKDPSGAMRQEGGVSSPAVAFGPVRDLREGFQHG